MQRYLVWIQVISQILVTLSEKLPSPQDVYVDALLHWKPVSADINFRYTVEYQIFDNSLWKNVPGCTRTNLTSCNITSSKLHEKCVRLRVRAEREGRVSRPVNACSLIRDDFCSPAVKLTSYPGFLLVHIQNSSLYEQYAGHASAKVSYAKEGEQLKVYKKTSNTGVPLPISEGTRYCVQVQYELYQKSYGLPSCTLCEDIPKAKTNHKTIVMVSVGVLSFLGMILVTAYLYFFKWEQIKHGLMETPMRVPHHYYEFLSQRFSEQPQGLATYGNVESTDRISILSRDEGYDCPHVCSLHTAPDPYK